MKKGKKALPHVEKRSCWCEPVWVAGRINPGALLHRRTHDGPPEVRLEEANTKAGTR